MQGNIELPIIFEGCKPRQEIIDGSHELETFAANLSRVVSNDAPEIYQNPEKFFGNTYPTDGLRTTINEVFGRLTGSFPGKSVIKLETGLGGGKTHSLIALYHLAKQGSTISNAKELLNELDIQPMHVAAIVGTEVSLTSTKGPRTLWGEIAQQLFGDAGYKSMKRADEQMISPGEKDLRILFGENKSLILIDELALYLARASAVKVGNTSLAEQTLSFLQEISQVADSMDNVELVVTALDTQSVFKDRTEEINKLLESQTEENEIGLNITSANKILSRVVQTLEPTKGEEFAHIIRHRLFESINSKVRDRVIDSYLAGYRSEGVKEYLPSIVQDPEYRGIMIKSYPFHPDIIDILRTKTSSIDNFNRTRGVLRFLSVLLKTVHDRKLKISLIHPYHIDFSEDLIYSELISRLEMGEIKPAIVEDLTNKDKDTRAVMVDKTYSEPYGTWVTTIVLLHSLTGKLKADVRKGATKAEVHLALHRPGKDPETIEKVLDALDSQWFYFGKEGQTYVCGLNPRLNKIIENAKEQIEQTKVNQEIESWIRKTYKSRKFFQPAFFPSAPNDVNDDTNLPKLVIMHQYEAKMRMNSKAIPHVVKKIFNETGTQGKPRMYINNLIFMLPDEAQLIHMEVQVRNHLALRQLIQDYEAGASYISGITKGQLSELKRKRQESEMLLKIAILIGYKHFIIPSSQTSIAEPQERIPLRVISMRETDREIEARVKSGSEAEDDIVKFLKDNANAKTADDNSLAPDRILSALWSKTTKTLTGDDFKKMFYRSPSAGIHFSGELIRKSMKAGIKEGKWYAVVGDRFFSQEEWQSFNPAFTADVTLTIVSSEEGRKLYQQFHPPDTPDDGGGSSGGTESEGGSEGGGPVPPIGPDGPLELTFKKSRSGLSTLANEFNAWATDKNVSLINSARFKAYNRGGLSALSRALNQFRTKIEVKYDISGILQRDRFEYEIKYKGDEGGFSKLKSAVIDFMGQEEFDNHDLHIHVSFVDGYSADNFYQDVSEKIAQFATGMVYDLEIMPKKE